MDTKEIIKQIESYISNNKTKEAIKCLSDCQFENGIQGVILLKSRFNRVQNELLLGVLSREEANLELAQINHTVLGLTRLIKKPEVLPGQLDKTIAKDTTIVGTSDFQLDKTLAKETTKFSSDGAFISAIELETTDRRVQNSDGIFRIETDVLLGRHPDCDIIILDKGVSRRHTRIFRQGNQLIISDENSTNGTFLNDQRINEIAVSEDGILRLDEVNFTLRVIKKS